MSSEFVCFCFLELELPHSCGLRVTSLLVQRSNQETPFKSEQPQVMREGAHERSSPSRICGFEREPHVTGHVGWRLQEQQEEQEQSLRSAFESLTALAV